MTALFIDPPEEWMVAIVTAGSSPANFAHGDASRRQEIG
jgi:hypothetical protein